VCYLSAFGLKPLAKSSGPFGTTTADEQELVPTVRARPRLLLGSTPLGADEGCDG
jgi:hypothetical protein